MTTVARDSVKRRIGEMGNIEPIDVKHMDHRAVLVSTSYPTNGYVGVFAVVA